MEKVVWRSFLLAKILGFCSFVLLFSCTVEPPQPLDPVPTASQLEWHKMELSAFIHFSINTFTDKEWGFGDESPTLFNPDSLDAEQWAETLKAAGFKCIILTCKHHDGFCLWPSQYTDHSVKNSPFENGEGDVVKAVSDACKKHGLRFGIYLSPWDRNHAGYGTEKYIRYYRNQIKELFENYGPVFEMWFDGANGGDGYYGGANQVRRIDGSTYYDWPTTLEVVRSYNSNVIFFSDAGPGVRWVGNEKGVAGVTNWNTITPDTLYAGKAGIEDLLNSGSEGGSHWIPAEVDVSIRPGWFYHEKEDSLVKTPEQLFDIYLSSVGRGSTLLLNVPPDRHGLIHPADSIVLTQWREMINNEFANDLLKSADVSTSERRGRDYAGKNLVDGNSETYWCTSDDVTQASVEITPASKIDIKYVLLQEDIRLGQRVQEFNIEGYSNNEWTKIGEGTTIGYKRIIRVNAKDVSKLRITIGARACPVISAIEAY